MTRGGSTVRIGEVERVTIGCSEEHLEDEDLMVLETQRDIEGFGLWDVD